MIDAARPFRSVTREQAATRCDERRERVPFDERVEGARVLLGVQARDVHARNATPSLRRVNARTLSGARRTIWSCLKSEESKAREPVLARVVARYVRQAGGEMR